MKTKLKSSAGEWKLPSEMKILEKKRNVLLCVLTQLGHKRVMSAKSENVKKMKEPT